MSKKWGTCQFDGEGYESASGVHGKRGYQGDYMFVFMGASTPIKPRVWKMMGNLGSRLFFINVGSKEKDEDELALQLLDSACREKELKCRKVTRDFVRTLWSRHPEGIVWDHSSTPKETIGSISRMAKLLARLRARIDVWQVGESEVDEFGDEKKVRLSHSAPLIERPDRINQLLYNFARGHAVSDGRLVVNDSDIELVLKLVLESASYERSKLFRYMVANHGEIKSSQVVELFGCTKPTALKYMEELVKLGLARKSESMSHDGEFVAETRLHLNHGHQWLLDLNRKWPHLFEV